MYLVCACARADERAVREFDDRYLRAEVRVGASRLRCSADEIDEIEQEVRRALYAPGQDEAPKLAHMTARGDLRALLRLMALRAGISLRRKAGRLALTDDERVFDLAGADDSPSLVFAREQHRALFRDALTRGLDKLDAKHRTALRMHVLDGVPLARLAAMYHVDRSTVSRWIARAREVILSETRRQLSAAHGIGQEQFDSFLDVIRSNFGVSLQRMLGSRRGGDE
jgi:RNA polymerase sigma-70 factor (ECF subfamily)